MDHWEKRRADYLALIKGEVKAQVERPLINEKTPFFSFTPTHGTPQTSNSPVDYAALWEIWLTSPEAIAPCDTIVTDIISDGYKIKPVRTGSSGNQLVKNAEQFLTKNQFKTRVMPSILYDKLVTGDGYLYKPKLSEEQVRKAVRSRINGLPITNKRVMENYVYYTMVDEDTYNTKELIALASSTVKITHDIHGNVVEYYQKVGENEAHFSVEEIIHFKYMHLNGRVYSFCPMKALIPELTLIAAVKDTAGNIFSSGGLPNYFFNLEEEVPEGSNVKFLQEQLKQFKEMVNQNHSLVTTGKVTCQPIESLAKDMQFRELLEQMTRIVYTAWGVPPSKMGQQAGESGAYDTGLATEGYYRRIAHLQDKFYTPFNDQLMIPEFGVMVIPNKAYLQDEEREIQTLKQKFDIAQQAWQNNWWNDDAVTDFLEIPDGHKGSFEREEMEGMLNQGLRQKKEVGQSTPSKGMNEMRRETQEDVKALLDKGYTRREAEAILNNG